jgi:aerobic carbon-monoxide dehydrogenase large subunit
MLFGIAVKWRKFDVSQFGFGRAVLRTEDLRLLSGRGTFVADVNLPGQAYGFVLRSNVAHAEIVRIEADGARRLPGVLAVLTGAEYRADGLGGIPIRTIPGKDGKDSLSPFYPALALDKVRFVGEPVAMIVAESLDLAMDAAEAVRVEFRELKAVVDPVDALTPGAPAIHAQAPDNLCFHWSDGEEAATKAALERAHRVVRIELVNNRLICAAMETRGAVGAYDAARGEFFLHTTSQGSHHIREFLADGVFRIAKEKIRVVTKDVGGGFGMKYFCYPEHALTLWAAKRSGRPVKWVASRSEAFLSDVHGRAHVTRAALGVDRDGRFLGLRVQTVADLGAQLSNFAVIIPTLAGQGMQTGCYRIPVAYNEVKGAFTNTVPVDAYRGAGRPEAAYMIERLVDAAARQTGIDPVEIRRRNFAPHAAMPYKSCLGVVFDSGDFVTVLDKGLTLADWSGFPVRRAEAERRGKLRGIGLGYYIERCGGGGEERAQIEFAADGKVILRIGTMNNGQGHETAYAQLVSEALGVAFDRIEVRQGDTAEIKTGAGTGGSRSLPVGGHSCLNAAAKVIEKGKRIASGLLEAAAGDIEFKGGLFRVVGTDRTVAIDAVAQAARDGKHLGQGEAPALDGADGFTPKAPTFPNGAHIVEVEIDPETGVPTIVAYTVSDDFGRVINPLLLAGQVHGGIVQGVGQALTERTVFDPANGQLLTASFMDYRLPRAADLPAIRFAYTEAIPCAVNPMGVKGAGEAGAIGAPPAIINAIVDALSPLGVKNIDMPATPLSIWTAIQNARAA